MVVALLVLLSCELLGDALRAALGLPIPGTVIGMLLLTAILTLMGPRPATAVGSALDRTAGTLLAFMGLLFVPAGVGIIAQGDLLRAQWLPIAGSVVGSTVLSLAVTAAVMHALGRRQGDAGFSEPGPSA